MVCAIAQPMLLEVYEAKTYEVDPVLEVEIGGKKRGSLVKLLVARHPTLALVALCPNVTELRVISMNDMSLEWLTAIPLLERFIFCGRGWNKLHLPSSTAVFPRLEEISLARVVVAAVPNEIFFQQFPSARCTPRLQFLALMCIRRRSWPDHIVPLLHLSPELVERLEVLTVTSQEQFRDLYTPDHTPPANLTVSVRVKKPLPSDLSVPLPPCLRLDIDKSDGSSVYPSEDILDTLGSLLELLTRSTAAGLSDGGISFLLPTGLPDEVETSDVLRQLEDEVLGTGGEVIRERAPDWLSESYVTPALVRRAERSKRDKEVKKREEEKHERREGSTCA